MSGAPATLGAAWAVRMGAPPDVFARHGTHVSVSAEVRGDRVHLYRTPAVTLIVLPTNQADEAERLAAALAAQAADARAVIAQLPEMRLGARWRDLLFELPDAQSAGRDHPNIHALDASDAAAFNVFSEACPEPDRRAGQVTLDDPLVIGWQERGRLLGAASLLYPMPGVADIGILVHPQARRRGIAVQLVRQIAWLAARAGKLAQYTAPEPNTASAGVARRSGFALALVEEGLQTDWP